MKLNKLLVAVVLSAAAANASAAIDVGAGQAQSEIVFSAWDANGNGYTFDLDWNETLDALAGAESAVGFLPAFHYDAVNQANVEGNTVVDPSLIGAGGVIYDSALTGFQLDGASTQWNLVALDNQGRQRLLTTADASVTNFDVQGQKLFGAANTVSGYFPATTSFNATTDADTYATTVATDGAAYAGNFSNSWGGNLFDVTNTLGSDSFLYELAQGSANPGLETAWFSQVTGNGENVIAKTYQENGEWRFQLAIAQTAPIPEPQTYAMLLAGLGVMGASARRRIK